MGVLFGLSWLTTMWRTDQWIIYFQERIAQFEQTEPEPAEVPVFSGPDWNRITRFPITFNRVVKYLAGLATLGWTTATVSAFIL
jgi:hypothetical protein